MNKASAAGFGQVGHISCKTLKALNGEPPDRADRRAWTDGPDLDPRLRKSHAPAVQMWFVRHFLAGVSWSHRDRPARDLQPLVPACDANLRCQLAMYVKPLRTRGAGTVPKRRDAGSQHLPDIELDMEIDNVYR